MNEEITIVTGFFNIKRGEWNSFRRSNAEYIEYFALWSKMKNKLIVYVESQEIASEVIAIRDSYGLRDRTTIKIIDNFDALDLELYKHIKLSTNNITQTCFRMKPFNPESFNHNYNYVMLLKEWCVADAVKHNLAEGMIAWVDFGYNHGGKIIHKESDFNFQWKYNFPQKICIFANKDIDDRPIFDIVRSMDVYIMGTIIVAPDYLWGILWDMVRTEMIALCKCGLVDDDQTILLMAYKSNKDLFNLYKCDWNMQLKICGADHLIVNPSEVYKNSLITRIKKKIKNAKNYFECIRYSLKQINFLYKNIN